ncbi:MAG: flippase-like domain-containing protein [Candidatus Omnitrophica bacterium]|nr:flippase-like domain-containing protein [Candidatus Omnitrophota bacterium]
MKAKNKALLYLRILVSIVLLLVLGFFMRGRFDELLNTIRSVNIRLFLLALTVSSCILVIHAYRLKLLFEVQKIYFSGIEAVKLSFLGMFFNNFMPSTIGGDMVKLYYAKKRAKNLVEPFSAIVMDRMLGLTALTMLGATALLFKSELIKNNTVKLIILSFFLIIIGFFILLFFKGMTFKIVGLLKRLKLTKFEHLIIKMSDTIFRFSKSSKVLTAFSLALSGQIMIIFCVYVLSRSLSLNLPISTFYVLIPVIQIVSVFPSINGLGVREGAFVYFFKDLLTPEYAMALSILYLGLMIPVSLVGGFIYMFYGKIDTKEVVV